MKLNIGLNTAEEEIRSAYDYETAKDIVNHGCASGVAHDHIYYSDTIKFFDTYEDEIIEYIADTLGGEYNEQLWTDNSCNLTGYKNDTVWTYVELIASLIVDQHEDIMQEIESDSELVIA